MSSSETNLAGPDLTAGTPTHSVHDGALLLGHAHGEPVILTRREGRFYAIGATCTHYGGPLAEGLVVGDTVRCPWHHACFSLRTGEALAAPALDPVSCFEVHEHDGKVFVGACMNNNATLRRSSTSGSPRPGQVPQGTLGGVQAREIPRSVIIVGAGAAGVAAADMLRREGYDGRLSLIDARETFPVDRPNLSKDYLAGHAEEEWVNLRPAEYYQQHEIELLLNTRVERIDVLGRSIETVNSRRLTFDRLLLATGAIPVRLQVAGSDLPHVYYLRTLEDSRAIIKAASQAKRAVVIGASFIGLEVAASLRARGVEVHVVAPDETPLQRVLGAELGEMVRTLHESKGVVFHLQHNVAAIETEQVRLTSGETLPAAFVVVGIGVRPDTVLAEQAGIAVENGVLVDQYLESSVPGIFAAGDIARWPDHGTGQRLRVEHWVVAERQGQTAARNMLGTREAYMAVPFFWSRHYDLSIDYVGHAERWDRLAIDGDLQAHDCQVTYYRGDRPLAVATVSRERASLEAEARFEDAKT